MYHIEEATYNIRRNKSAKIAFQKMNQLRLLRYEYRYVMRGHKQLIDIDLHHKYILELERDMNLSKSTKAMSIHDDDEEQLPICCVRLSDGEIVTCYEKRDISVCIMMKILKNRRNNVL